MNRTPATADSAHYDPRPAKLSTRPSVTLPGPASGPVQRRGRHTLSRDTRLVLLRPVQMLRGEHAFNVAV